MKALVIEKSDGSTELAFKDVEQPVPFAGEALIKVRLAGICRTDQELVKGYMDFTGIPGHEFVGDVVEVNGGDSSATELIAKRVAGEINCGCGTCNWCHSGLERHCPQRTVLGIAGKDGALAEYLTLPAKNLHVVPDDVADAAAVFTEPVAAALEILEQVKIPPNEDVLVVGDGKLGLLIARVLQIHGCHVLCLGGNEAKMSLLKKWGIAAQHYRTPIDATFNFAVEASGTSEGFATALSSLNPRGTLILKSTYAGDLTANAAPWVVNEIQIIGSRCGPFRPALNLIKQGLIDTTSLVTSIFPFKKSLEAFKMAGEADSLKVLLDFC